MTETEILQFLKEWNLDVCFFENIALANEAGHKALTQWGGQKQADAKTMANLFASFAPPALCVGYVRADRAIVLVAPGILQ
jgi:hypothetical protein